MKRTTFRTGTLTLAALIAGVLLTPPALARSRALLIGVGDVPNNALPAIDLDIDNMKKVAAVMGFAPGDIKVLFDEEATYANVQKALSTWVREGVQPNDKVLIYFSGHGTRVPDFTPGHAGGVDAALVMHDMERARVNGQATLKNVLMGHELGAALAQIPSRKVLVLVDACHSGRATRTIDLMNRKLGSSGYPKFITYPGMPTGESTRGIELPASGNENYAALSAAREEESAIGTEHGGLFTLGLVDAIDAAARDGRRPTVDEVRVATTAYIAAHTDPETRHHPMTDGNPQLIRGALDVVPLRSGQGPTWQALAALAAKATPLTVTAPAQNFRVGDEVTLSVNVPRAGYLNVVSIDSQDRATVLYPNAYAATNQVSTGTFQFPTASMNFVVRAAEPLGPSLVVAFLSDKPVNLLELGIEGRDAAGKMQDVFTEVSARATRALVVEARQPQFAAGTLTLTVRGSGSP
jgi:hypothetical protein